VAKVLLASPQTMVPPPTSAMVLGLTDRGLNLSSYANVSAIFPKSFIC